jgi:invasion protein IalB
LEPCNEPTYRRRSLRLAAGVARSRRGPEAGGGAARRRRAADEDRELWRLDLRCQRLADPAATNKLCEISLTIQAGQQPAPIAQIAMGRLAKTDPYHLTAHVPTNISLPSVVNFSTGDKDTHRQELAWRRCAPAGCFADSTLTDAQWMGLRGQTDMGSLEFIDAVGRPVKLPVSFRGLAQAMDALVKQ